MDGRPIRIQGDPDVIKEIEALMRESDDAQYLRTEEDDSGGIGADFELDTVATIIGIASSLFFDGPIIPKLYGILRRHRGTRISVETPTGSVSITASGDFSEESLRRALWELTRP
ncbi:hypothetical protein [Streptomyces sp. NRRL F-2580]|uniref:hypothetical protein n=1 Tax=Streptomyces sp. NRRL F-2580 TaxID=1463841 RepID=UPI0004C77D71|nr:hypothetical protein [Streptomyces sp. NRRL F-2580]